MHSLTLRTSPWHEAKSKMKYLIFQLIFLPSRYRSKHSTYYSTVLWYFTPMCTWSQTKYMECNLYTVLVEHMSALTLFQRSCHLCKLARKDLLRKVNIILAVVFEESWSYIYSLPVSVAQPFVAIKYVVVVNLPSLHSVQMQHRPEKYRIYLSMQYTVDVSFTKYAPQPPLLFYRHASS